MSSGSGFPALRPNGYRDAWCGQALGDRVGQTLRLSGWVHRRRDHGGLAFVDLRDRTGLVQLVFNPDTAGEAFELAHRIRPEDVLTVSGEIVRRDPETVNPELPTGEFELRVAEAKILAGAETPPFEIEGFAGEVGEEMRLRHRYLDLRRRPMQEAIALRHRVAKAIRDFLDGEGFLEVETPMLSRSTPEGARDFLVPWRREPGSFYALPQSPQLFKQLLMVAGFERYFQIVRCFRDEDQRADRQPDFTQLDIEMSFVGVEDVIDLNERLLASVFDAVGGPALELPLRRIPYDEAIARYGTDRPDLRFGLELVELTDLLAGTEFKVFRGVVDSGGVIKGINAGARDVPRSALDGFIGRAQELGAKGLVWAFREGDGWRSPTAKFLSADELAAINERFGAAEGDLMLVVADRPAVANSVLAQLRLDLAERFELVDPEAEAFCWIVDWPMFAWNEEEARWDPLHHPFTAPVEPAAFDPARAGEARALAYDVVWNGQEMGGGSIRISDPGLQRAVLETIGIGAEEARHRFGFLLDALRYGAPPHGGIAYGVDRIVQRLIHAESIRDVIAFPKAASGADPLTGAPAPVDEAQLRELGLAVTAQRTRS
jgi:aspartyl-tRNA synthetase